MHATAPCRLLSAPRTICTTEQTEAPPRQSRQRVGSLVWSSDRRRVSEQNWTAITATQLKETTPHHTHDIARSSLITCVELVSEKVMGKSAKLRGFMSLIAFLRDASWINKIVSSLTRSGWDCNSLSRTLLNDSYEVVERHWLAIADIKYLLRCSIVYCGEDTFPVQTVMNTSKKKRVKKELEAAKLNKLKTKGV